MSQTGVSFLEWTNTDKKGWNVFYTPLMIYLGNITLPPHGNKYHFYPGKGDGALDNHTLRLIADYCDSRLSDDIISGTVGISKNSQCRHNQLLIQVVNGRCRFQIYHR